MRIGIVGGVERSEASYREVASSAGHEVAFHPGHTGGRARDSLAALVRGADVVVVITEINSHGAVGIVRREARARRVPVKLVRRFGTKKLAELLAG